MQRPRRTSPLAAGDKSCYIPTTSHPRQHTCSNQREGGLMDNIPVFNCKNADDVLKAVKENNISFVQFWFVDILGML